MAIILCGVPILVGAFRGVVFEHDIKADLLVSLVINLSAVLLSALGILNPVRRTLAQLGLCVCGGQRGASAAAEGYRFCELRGQK